LIAGTDTGAIRLAQDITGQFYRENAAAYHQAVQESTEVELEGHEWQPALPQHLRALRATGS
jgi:hypothetical protein